MAYKAGHVVVFIVEGQLLASELRLILDDKAAAILKGEVNAWDGISWKVVIIAWADCGDDIIPVVEWRPFKDVRTEFQ